MATVGQPGALRRITVHYTNSPTRSTAEANLDDLDDELLQFVLSDVLPGQEGLYQSILEEAYSNQNHMRGAGAGPTAPSGHPQHYYHGESSGSTAAATVSRTSGTDEEQIASDFEYAKQLQQEMEDLSVEDDDISCVPSPSDSEDEHDHRDDEANRQDGDDVDPDNMTYEQRQALGESMGTEDRGLSDELISYLEPWKYKGSGLFSSWKQKPNPEGCTICLSTFKGRESMITLPCNHYYHAACITKWLKVNKTCPVCKYELFGAS